METNQSITLSRKSSPEERKQALRQIYFQVLECQPYEAERQQLEKAEKDFLKGKIGVRRFLKMLGHSDLYLEKFYYSASNSKFLETCLKHFLGRSIRNGEEMRFHSNKLSRSGVYQFILDILDSDEYRKFFGCFTVPYYRGNTCHETPNQYLENSLVEHEHFGQRGFSLPTLYWHQLGMNCDSGVCLYIDEELSPKAQYAVELLNNLEDNSEDKLQTELMELLVAL